MLMHGWCPTTGSRLRELSPSSAPWVACKRTADIKAVPGRTLTMRSLRMHEYRQEALQLNSLKCAAEGDLATHTVVPQLTWAAWQVPTDWYAGLGTHALQCALARKCKEVEF